MKKAFLSLALIFVFSAYVLYVRILGTDLPTVLTPEPNKTKTALSLPQYNGTTQTTSTNSVASSPSSPGTKPKPSPTPTPAPVINTGKYRNGSYVGNSVDAYYGNVQVKAVITGGRISDVQFLDYPQDRQNSVRINSRAMPYLISEAIAAQDSNVDAVSGASFTSAAYVESLSSALAQARI